MGDQLRDIVLATFTGLDEDILEYVVSLVEENGLHDEDTKEQVAMFLQSAEYCETEEEATEKVSQLAAELEKRNMGGSAEADSGLGSGPVLLDKPIELAVEDVDISGNKDLFVQGTESNILANRNATFEGTGAKQSKRDARKAKRAELKRLNEQNEEEETLGVADIQSAVFSEESVLTDVALSTFDLCNKKGSGPDLLVNANITFAQGRRYGLVGKNGVGKSTFMEAFNRREIHGMKWLKQSILLVKQEVEGNSMSPLEWVMKSDGLRSHIQKKIDHITQSTTEGTEEELADLYTRLEGLNVTKGERQAATILRGLGFDDGMQKASTKSLSGGWRRRVALACALFVKPDILLLDEPTNHLDLETVLWLQNFLNSDDFQQTLLVVSHDRNFLNAVVTDIVLFRNAKLEVYKGDYFSFLSTMEQNKITKQRQRDAQEMKRAHLQEYITKHALAGENGPKAARQRKSRMKKLERLGMEAAAQNTGRRVKMSYDGEVEDVEVEENEAEITLTFPDPGKLDGTIIKMDQVEFKYEGNDKLHLTDININFDQSSRVAILGRNGCGKSTLIKLITGSLQPIGGFVTLKQNGRIEYIAQHHSEELDLESNAMDTMLARFPGDHSTSHINDIRKYLGRFGLVGDTLPVQQIKTLSGGQKCRIALALALYKQPHFLIMDEPTNHLDMETTTALIDAIKEFRGGVLIVSHDEFLLKQVCNELYYVKNNGLHRFNGDFADYKKLVLKGKH